ncbi:hypothetical protein HYC85_004029 [Camellia sinensis]|uniref:Uncharacterized protein n=1 Tax=Camellia sinensis TaxID=4442 RepID=A0A7J7HXI2_CAMSI|nr:hypothetical protein HYC85_004029 [Camellia sinensis]
MVVHAGDGMVASFQRDERRNLIGSLGEAEMFLVLPKHPYKSVTSFSMLFLIGFALQPL